MEKFDSCLRSLGFEQIKLTDKCLVTYHKLEKGRSIKVVRDYKPLGLESLYTVYIGYKGQSMQIKYRGIIYSVEFGLAILESVR